MNDIMCKSTQMVNAMATRTNVRCLSCGAKTHDIKIYNFYIISECAYE